MKKDFDGKHLGFICTPRKLAEAMVSLCKNTGTVLDPACGAGLGAFEFAFPNIVGVELSAHRNTRGVVSDFLSWEPDRKFDTILCNPPYVKSTHILPSTLAYAQKVGVVRLNGKANLYLHFINKCLGHLAPGGELIFVNPRGFIKDTSAAELNSWMVQNGSITDFVDLGDAKVFDGATPNCAIWRFVLGAKQQEVLCGGVPRELLASNGTIQFVRRLGDYAAGRSLGDVATIRVGAVSGADSIFTNDLLGDVSLVSSETRTTGRTRRMIYDPSPAALDYLMQHKRALLSRAVGAFSEKNWYAWGRSPKSAASNAVYVNCKTRQDAPFFTHDCRLFDGAILAIEPLSARTRAEDFCAALNDTDWSDLGFVVDGRFIFTQRSLKNAPLPKSLAKFLP